MKNILILLTLLFIGCNQSIEKKITPNPKYHDTIYIKPDSSICIVKFFGLIKGKDTTYFYGIEKDSSGIIIRRVIYEKDIFGMK